VKTTRIHGLYAVSALTVALLAGCGNGDAGDSVTINGQAATGAAIAGATVSVKCVDSTSATTTTTANDGTFSVVVAPPGTPPCLVEVTKGSTKLYGLANAAGHINVTPITDLLVTRALGGDPGAAFANYNAGKAATIRANLDAARTYVQDSVSALAGGLVTGDPLTKTFAIGDSDDKLLDQLASTLATSGKTLADLRAFAVAGTALRAALPPEESRPHDTFAYVVNATDAAATTFAAMAAAGGDTVDMSTTSRWAGVLDKAAYRVEVPANWNGELVMYTHGYAGEGLTLNAVNSSIRRFLVQQGYAWAASSYSANSYDVRAGIEDTNRLALNFNAIAAARGRTLAKPSRTYIIGHSMGGHIAAAAVEAETYATSVNKVRYDGSMPMCGVVGDTTLFDTFSGMQAAAHVLSGNAAVALDQWTSIKTAATAALFSNFGGSPPLTPTAGAGQAYFSVLQNLTGGSRPLVDLGYGYGGSFQAGPYGVFGTTTATTGLTTKPTADTSAIVYKVDGQADLSATLNATAPKASAPADANRLRRDGLRWIPKVNGQPQAPVLTMHTLGDLFVPFNMEQVYRQRLTANGNGDKVVQRAIRGVTHCDFTNAEMKKGFTDLVAWVKAGTKPAGDDVLTAATVANARYGCSFTNDTVDQDDAASTGQLRGLVTQAGRACSALP
jgi:pimeloyl-ACP methyl ester carboxylesterase